jgi:hypothetical protein
MQLKDTVTMMNSTDYKERFRAEYFQLSNRIEGLSNMLDKYRKGTLNFTPKCTKKLLDAQLHSMIIYKTHLEERAKIEDISLEEVATSKETTIVTNQKVEVEK